MNVEVRLLLGGHSPVTGDLHRYERDESGEVQEIVEPDTRVIRWDELPAVTVDATDDRPLREVFEEAFALFQRDQGLAYHFGHHQMILFDLYEPGFEENVLTGTASEQVAQWHRQGIHDPRQIRTFLALRHEWTPAQAGKLLSLDDDSAARLLKAMGYLQLDTGLYVLGQTEEAKAEREDWKRAERQAERDA
ncbi:hypothetical protein [Tenggerimyces flavus]|uniref:Uncharacterized protein n=1 Tax=Tenggerimyces flavus TaxID=1708749 RepID=A0ABV7Y4R0_9ACTN|nr:hypothetical protein [Tenggerimyces flavus]MBM7791292.1 hypothetical protein [Tenggerimyces flavus]